MTPPNRNNRTPKAPAPLPPGTIVDARGETVAAPGEFAFSERPVEADETVYRLFEAIVPRPEGETMGIQLPVKPGWMFVTFKIPGGDPDDCGLVYLRGKVPPPKGTRFALRMLPPEEVSDLRELERRKAMAKAKVQNSEAVAAVTDPLVPPDGEGFRGP